MLLYGSVFLAAGLGGLLRFSITGLWLSSSSSIPWAIFTINIVGSLLMGVLMGVRSNVDSPYWTAEMVAVLGAGFLGGLTTFSSLAWDVVRLFSHSQPFPALFYLVGSNVVGVLACYFGWRWGGSVRVLLY